MKIAVIGLGYIGLPTAAVLASRQIEVIGVDVNKYTVDTINKGKIHIAEPGLGMLVHASVNTGHLRATMKPEKADVYMVAVPTPFLGDHEPDLSFIESAVKSIAPVLTKGNLVILESTSPVNTTEKVVEWMQEIRPDLSFPEFAGDGSNVDISVAHCPERVLPGHIIRELIENDRIIGGITTACAERARNLYKTFVQGDCVITDSRTAELSKIVENSFRDVNIAFANELSLVCDKLDIDVWGLIKLANRHPRVNILQPGPGVGGHCVAVDPWFLVHSAPEEAKLIRTARLVNDQKPKFVLRKILEEVSKSGKDISKLTISCLGIAFKANIDDLRESPAQEIALEVTKMGFLNCYIVEPNIEKLPNNFPVKTILSKAVEAIEKSDIIILLVDHDEFELLDASLLLGKHLIDTRGIFA